MAAGTLITVLSNIPWGQVIENAPKVADGAMKLWNAATNRKKKASDPNEPAPDSAGAALSEEERLKARLRALEDDMKSLQDQMQASSELIKALAEQNTQLVRRVELHRIRLVRFATATAGVGLILLIVVLYALARP